jgi:Flp pilus assembly protein TadD
VRLRALLLLGLFCGAVAAQETSPLGEAEKLLGQRKYAAAEKALAAILASEPRNARAHGNLALALLAQGKTREAIDEGRLAAAFGPDLPEARYIYGLTLAAGGNPREAARELEKALAGRADAPAPLGALADAYATTGDPRAAGLYRRLIALEPSVPRHRASLAEHLWRVDLPDEGNRVMEEALKAFPANEDLHLRYGRALVRQHRPSDAAAQLEAARELGATGEAFALLLASAYAEAGRGAEAERVLEAAARTYPASADVPAELGRLRLAAGNAGEALPSLEAAARLNPRSAVTQLDLGRARETLGKLDEAEAAYRAAVRLAPNLPRARYALGRLLLRRGKREEAEVELAIHRDAYEKGVKKVSENEALTGELALGFARLKEGDAPAALEIFARLPEGTDSLIGRAEALSRLGRHGEAVRALERARSLDPEEARLASLLAAERSRAAEPK